MLLFIPTFCRPSGNTSDNVYICGTDLTHYGIWTPWMPNCQLNFIPPWGTGQPDNLKHDEQCLLTRFTVQATTVSDWNCFQQYTVICQIPLFPAASVCNPWTPPVDVCPTGWVMLSEACYMILSTPSNQAASEAACQALNPNAHLPFFTSNATYIEFVNYV